MSQPPSAPILAHENVRNVPSLSQKTFYDAAAGAGTFYDWEFDLALGITDANQFLNTNSAPVGSTHAPQPAVGPWCDWVVYTTGAGGGQMLVQYAVDANPCTYVNIFLSAIPSGVLTNASGLRVTGRFVRLAFQNLTAGATVQVGFYIRSWT